MSNKDKYRTALRKFVRYVGFTLPAFAEHLGASRQAVYYWTSLKGSRRSVPSLLFARRIEQLGGPSVQLIYPEVYGYDNS